MSLPSDYEERVYAGVLGKIIGVYLGRPFEGWSQDAIEREFGEVNYYVHEKRGVPLIVTDDDISGTFTFPRALPDNGNPRDLPAKAIGQSWLNYIIERRTILWWGGMGNSTEHTAFLRLKQGHEAPVSGSIDLNGRTVAEQIGAQIFIDGWAMVAPGDPEYAVDLARRAASVSHDGEAIHGAMVVAALESQAFVESNLEKLLDTAAGLIPRDSVIRRLIHDLRDWRRIDDDWRKTRRRINAHYGYDRYGGNCHMVPNHALILLGLLYSEDDFQRALMITNTAGWDTDCNSGNVGCIMGIKNGLRGIDAGPDWRGPVADRILLPTAEGGRAITDAAREAMEIVSIGRALSGLAASPPKGGARFHFELPGSVQGFVPDDSPEARGTATVSNSAGHSESGTRSLAIHYDRVTKGRGARVATATFITPEMVRAGGYELVACPTLYPGQTVKTRIEADAANSDPVDVVLFIRQYGARDEREIRRGPVNRLAPGESARREWRLEGFSPAPIADIGVEIVSEHPVSGTVYLDTLTWDGPPSVTFSAPQNGGEMWRHAWVNACRDLSIGGEIRLMQDEGEGAGLAIQGTREWRYYSASAEVTPRLIDRGGIAVCVQGRKRWVGLLLTKGGKASLVKSRDGETVLAEAEADWAIDRSCLLQLTTIGNRFLGSVDGRIVFDVTDEDRPIDSGAVAYVVESGRMDCGPMTVTPVE